MSRIRQHAPPSPIRQAFACRLQQLRTDYGNCLGRRLSQRSFGILLGIDSQRYGSYERADREPTLEILAALRRVTGVSLDELLAPSKDDLSSPPHNVRQKTPCHLTSGHSTTTSSPSSEIAGPALAKGAAGRGRPTLPKRLRTGG